jgi:pimeloyl-ACP methyl ester carboxylesterase
MATLTRDGIELHYDVTSGSGQSYAFVHGWTCNREYFRPQAKYFAAKGHTVLTLDLRGHGASTVPEGTPITIADFAADVGAIIAATGLNHPIVVGHSMGGLIVLKLAVDYPGHVGGIVMVDPAPLIWTDEFAQGVDAVVAAMKVGDQGPRRDFISEALFLPTDDVAVKEKTLADMLGTPVHVAVAAMESVRAFDGPGMASRCKVPTLHIGAAIPLNPLAQLEGLIEGAVSGQTVGAGHLHQLLVPVQVNDMIERFARIYVWKDGPR